MSEGGAAVPGEIPPVPPAPMALARGNGDGGGSKVDLHFSHEMTDTLHITDIDENTFTDEITTQTEQTFIGQTTYIYWQLKEQCILQRRKKKDHSLDPDPVSRIEYVTPVDYTDAFKRHSGGGGS
jgi:hypothetical protein